MTKAYLPAAQALRERLARGAEVAKQMAIWERRVRRCWHGLHIGPPSAAQSGNSQRFTVSIYLGEMAAEDVRVEIYADPREGDAPEIVELARGEAIAGAANGYIYSGLVGGGRPVEDFTARIVPSYPGVQIPTEMPFILWQK